ncbi:MAG TPA: DnaA N-terminal domain-containing protein [Herpetosiphonaceae bacterium]
MNPTFDPRMTVFFGDAVLRAGFLPTPHLFLRHYVELGLDSTLAMFVLQLMETTWDLGTPPRTSRDFAQRMGVGTKAIQRYTSRVEALGLLHVIPQFDASGAQVENRYDLSPLFTRLAALVAERSYRQERRVPFRKTIEAQHQAAQPGSRPAMKNRRAARRVSPPVDTHGGEGQIRPDPSDQAIWRGPDQVIPGPRIDRSGLKETLRISNKQQEAALHDALPMGGKPDQAANQSRQQAAWSIRQQRPLTCEEIACSHTVLTRMAIENPVRARIADGVAPEDIWALRVYSAAKGWSPALTVSQVYDKRHKQAQVASDLAQEHYALGAMLAALDRETAEAVLAAVLHACPHEPQQLAGASLLDVPAVACVVEALWRVVAQLRGYPQAVLSIAPSGEAPSGDSSAGDCGNRGPIWDAALRELQRRIPYREFVTWLESSALLDLEDHADRAHAVIGVSNIFARDHVVTTYLPVMEETLANVLGKVTDVQVELASPQERPYSVLPSTRAGIGGSMARRRDT